MINNQGAGPDANSLSIDPNNPPISAIRWLLLAAFSDKTLNRFCWDRPAFRDLIDRFSQNDSSAVMVDQVLAFCHHRAMWDELLAEVSVVNPRQYKRFLQRLADGTDASGSHQAIYSSLESTAYTRLPRDHVRSFATLIADKTEDFVGRQFVFDALDQFLRDNKSGYWIVRGVPGIGKTALLAQLVKTRGYAHHFNVAPMNIRTPRQFLANACAQIIARYRLPCRSLPASATEDSGFLVQCMGEAAAVRENRPVVLVVDALDESDRLGIRPGGNLLHLPPALPQGAYIVVSSRPLDDLQLQVSNAQGLFLEPDSEGNLLDIQTYIANHLQADAQLRSRLAEWRVSEQAFAKGLEQKSEGNFIYLRYVLPAISAGEFRHGTVDELPLGLTGYYDRHWRQMRAIDEEAWLAYRLPVIGFLAVAREPGSVWDIASWAGLEPARVLAAIRDWREFLVEECTGGEKRYRIYHASFQSFLAEKDRGREIDLKQSHSDLVDEGLRQWAAMRSGAADPASLSPKLDYVRGLQRLQMLIEERAPGLRGEFLKLESRMLANLNEESYGRSERTRAERATLVDGLNDLAGQAGLEPSFNDLCRGA